MVTDRSLVKVQTGHPLLKQVSCVAADQCAVHSVVLLANKSKQIFVLHVFRQVAHSMEEIVQPYFPTTIAQSH